LYTDTPLTVKQYTHVILFHNQIKNFNRVIAF
jgi:hypothetical protein